MLVSIDTLKCFLGKIGEKYSFRKKSESQHEKSTSSESSVNEVMMAGENNLSTWDPASIVTDGDGLMELFNQLSGFMSPMLHWLKPNTIVITEASLTGKSTTYQVTIQIISTTTLLDTGENISVVSKKFFGSLPQTPQLLKAGTYKVMSVSGAYLGPIV